jgi:hypothetical protein
MASLTIPHSFTSGTTIESAKVNANFSAIATYLNTTKLTGTDNIQDSSIGSRQVDLTCGAQSLSSDQTIAGPIAGGTADILSANITPAVASYAFVFFTVDLLLEHTSTTLDVNASAKLRVDGADEASGASAVLDGQWTDMNNASHNIRATVSQHYRTPLTAASHTILVRVTNGSTGPNPGVTIKAYNTKLIWFLIAQ